MSYEYEGYSQYSLTPISQRVPNDISSEITKLNIPILGDLDKCRCYLNLAKTKNDNDSKTLYNSYKFDPLYFLFIFLFVVASACYHALEQGYFFFMNLIGLFIELLINILSDKVVRPWPELLWFVYSTRKSRNKYIKVTLLKFRASFRKFLNFWDHHKFDKTSVDHKNLSSFKINHMKYSKGKSELPVYDINGLPFIKTVCFSEPILLDSGSKFNILNLKTLQHIEDSYGITLKRFPHSISLRSHTNSNLNLEKMGVYVPLVFITTAGNYVKHTIKFLVEKESNSVILGFGDIKGLNMHFSRDFLSVSLKKSPELTNFSLGEKRTLVARVDSNNNYKVSGLNHSDLYCIEPVVLSHVNCTIRHCVEISCSKAHDLSQDIQKRQHLTQMLGYDPFFFHELQFESFISTGKLSFPKKCPISMSNKIRVPIGIVTKVGNSTRIDDSWVADKNIGTCGRCENDRKVAGPGKLKSDTCQLLVLDESSCLLCEDNCSCFDIHADVPLGSVTTVDDYIIMKLPRDIAFDYFYSHPLLDELGSLLKSCTLLHIFTKGKLSDFGVSFVNLLDMALCLCLKQKVYINHDSFHRRMVNTDKDALCVNNVNNIVHNLKFEKNISLKNEKVGVPTRILDHKGSINLEMQSQGVQKDIMKCKKNSNPALGNFIDILLDTYPNVCPRSRTDLGRFRNPNFELKLEILKSIDEYPRHKPFAANFNQRKASMRILKVWLESGLIKESN